MDCRHLQPGRCILKHYVNKITEPIDCIVLGRKTGQGLIPFTAGVAANPDDPQFTSGQKFTDTHKVVFTRTLDTSAWANTVLAKGDLVDEITKLKQQDGKDIIAYGGATFVSALIRQGLIDEFHLFINPAAIGNGLPIFKELDSKQKLTLVKTTSLTAGLWCFITSRNAAKQGKGAGLVDQPLHENQTTFVLFFLQKVGFFSLSPYWTSDRLLKP